MTWPRGKWPYLFFTIVALIITRWYSPETAEWVRFFIVDLTRSVVSVIPNLGDKL